MLFQITRKDALCALNKSADLGYPDYTKPFEYALICILLSEIKTLCYSPELAIDSEAFQSYLKLMDSKNL